eukprot:TRINITY_DN1310_c1_g3_i1.p1 TRINITY_DN1310_c1_g3~~TRINITY_DN1310_c1_g3_i1.p1  ORF type:complete len:489 (+),score=98.86 TRINITY_DN1310_c1_g3_i1:41-1507(+)
MLLRRAGILASKRWKFDNAGWISIFRGGRRVFKNEKLNQSYGESWYDETSDAAYYYKLDSEGNPGTEGISSSDIPFEANSIGEWVIVAGGFRHKPTGQIWHRHYDNQQEPFYEQPETNRKEWNPQPAPPTRKAQPFGNSPTPPSSSSSYPQQAESRIASHRAKMHSQREPQNWQQRLSRNRAQLYRERDALLKQAKSLGPTDIKHGGIRTKLGVIRRRLADLDKGVVPTTATSGKQLAVVATQPPAPVSEMDSWEIGSTVYLIDDIKKIQHSISLHGGNAKAMLFVEKLRSYIFKLENWSPKKTKDLDCIMLQVQTTIPAPKNQDNVKPAVVRITLPSDCLTDDEQLSTRRDECPCCDFKDRVYGRLKKHLITAHSRDYRACPCGYVTHRDTFKKHTDLCEDYKKSILQKQPKHNNTVNKTEATKTEEEKKEATKDEKPAATEKKDAADKIDKESTKTKKAKKEADAKPAKKKAAKEEKKTEKKKKKD